MNAFMSNIDHFKILSDVILVLFLQNIVVLVVYLFCWPTL